MKLLKDTKSRFCYVSHIAVDTLKFIDTTTGRQMIITTNKKITKQLLKDTVDCFEVGGNPAVRYYDENLKKYTNL